MSTPTYHCPQSRAPIPRDDIGVFTNLALCRKCGQTSPFSAMAGASVAPDEPLTLPKGVVMEKTLEGFRIARRPRSKMAFFLVPLMLVWSGGSLSAIYGRQLVKGHFSLMPSRFGLPFLIGTIFLGAMTLMTACGGIVIEQRGEFLECFTGVGPIGFRKRARWAGIRPVREKPTT